MNTEASKAPRTAGEGRAAREPATGHALPLALVTLAYLAVEFAFAARLLDVTGGHADPGAIDAIARWGRIVSGIALTLAVWGGLLLPRIVSLGWSIQKTAIALSTTAALCLGGAWIAEKALVDHIVSSSDGATRRTAAQLRVLSGAVLDGSAQLAGVDLSPETLARPEGKAFLAIFPFIAMSADGVSANPDDIMRQVYRSFAEQRYGTAEQVYNGVFIPSVRSLRDAFGRYIAAQRRLAEEVQSIPGHVEAAWSDYGAALAKRGVLPSSRFSPAARAAALSDARNAGAPVGDGWSPSDRRGFADAFAVDALRVAQANYEADVIRVVGGHLPTGLDWGAFIASEPVQTRWRASLGVDDDVAISSSMGFDAFRNLVYNPTLERAVSREAAPLVGPDEDFADGGRLEEAGRAAMQWLVVPPLALALSLIGALVHLFKVANYGTAIAIPALPRRRAALLVATAAIACGAYLAPNPISSSEAFDYFEARTLKRFGVGAAVASRWIVQAEPFFYPVGESARRFLLLGYDFGWGPQPAGRPESRTAAEPPPWAVRLLAE